MELIADGLLIATAVTAGLYCMVLSRRLQRLTDSGKGIGSQIDALDNALNEARAALEETREGVSELRGSTKSAIAQLLRETARGQEVTSEIQRAIAEAKTTMQRLYETGERLEAYEARRDGIEWAKAHDAEGTEGETITIQLGADPAERSVIDRADGGEDPEGEKMIEEGDCSGPKVVVPEGVVEGGPLRKPNAEKTAPNGLVLQAERLML
jgi:phosphoenolpyruvate-protein kinase (PTS system EI component)